MSIDRMIRGLLVLAAVLPAISFAQDFKNYRNTTLDTVIEEWKGRTKGLGQGISLSPPAKIKFVATMSGPPVSCSDAALRIVVRMIDLEDQLKDVKINNCLSLATRKGRVVTAHVQDVLVPGLNSDAKVGGPIEIWADVLAYNVAQKRSDDTLIMLINRFEPQ